MKIKLTSINTQRPIWQWILSLTIICPGILAYGYFYSKNESNNLLYLFGSNLLGGLIISVIFHYIIGPTFYDRTGYYHFSSFISP